jgi:hypothetical protein
MFEADQSSVSHSMAHSQSLRRTGLDPIGERPWGTHIALFYETLQDVLDVHTRYFGAGLASGEHCVWALSGQLTEQAAVEQREVMKRANVVNEEACQALLLKMRDEGLVKFDIHNGRWLIG